MNFSCLLSSLCKAFLFLGAAGAFFFGLPSEALAWGPGVHMVTGNWLLQSLALLPAEVSGARMAHPGLFLHGCLSADIFIGKGCVAREGHSHNWSSGLSLLEKAHTRAKLAYAYGYLAHLAADTVAHNLFVPGSLHWAFSLEAASPRVRARAVRAAVSEGFGRGKLAHVFLEMRADSAISWDRKHALSVFGEAGSKGAERMLMRAMHQRYWVFQLKKQFYRGSIALGADGLLRNLARLKKPNRRAVPEILSSRLTPDLDPKGLFQSLAPAGGNFGSGETPLADLLVLSARAMVDLLRDPEGSSVRYLDPVGTEALKRASKGLMPLRLERP